MFNFDESKINFKKKKCLKKERFCIFKSKKKLLIGIVKNTCTLDKKKFIFFFKDKNHDKHIEIKYKMSYIF